MNGCRSAYFEFSMAVDDGIDGLKGREIPSIYAFSVVVG